MSEPAGKRKFSPVVEGAIGAIFGTAAGFALWKTGMISAPAIPGVTLGLGLGSFFNAWYRGRNKDKGGN